MTTQSLRSSLLICFMLTGISSVLLFSRNATPSLRLYSYCVSTNHLASSNFHNNFSAQILPDSLSWQTPDWSIAVYPVPINENTRLRISTKKAERIKVELYDLRGNELLNIPTGVCVGECTQSLEIHKLTSGIYFLRVEINDQVWTQKLLQQ